MKTVITIALALAWHCLAGETLTVTTAEGESIADAEISRVTPEGITIVTAEGIRKLKWSSLPPDIKAKYAGAAAEQGDAELARLRARVATLESENAQLRSQIERLRDQANTPQPAVASPTTASPAPKTVPAPEPEEHRAYSKEWDRNALASKLDGGTQSGIKALLGPPTSTSAYSDGGDVWCYEGLTIVDRKSDARYDSVTIVFDKESGRNARAALVNFR